jgi:hypothetical protein
VLADTVTTGLTVKYTEPAPRFSELLPTNPKLPDHTCGVLLVFSDKEALASKEPPPRLKLPVPSAIAFPNTNVPAFILIPPLNVFVPLKLNTPEPDFTNPCPPVSVEEITTDNALF